MEPRPHSIPDQPHPLPQPQAVSAAGHSTSIVVPASDPARGADSVLPFQGPTPGAELQTPPPQAFPVGSFWVQSGMPHIGRSQDGIQSGAQGVLEGSEGVMSAAGKGLRWPDPQEHSADPFPSQSVDRVAVADGVGSGGGGGYDGGYGDGGFLGDGAVRRRLPGQIPPGEGSTWTPTRDPSGDPSG